MESHYQVRAVQAELMKARTVKAGPLHTETSEGGMSEGGQLDRTRGETSNLRVGGDVSELHKYEGRAKRESRETQVK